MRSKSLIMMLAFAASVAAQELSGRNDERMLQEEEDDDPDEPELMRELRKKQHCRETAQGPDEWCWLKSNKYQAQKREDKLNDIYNYVVGDSFDMLEYMWERHGQFFTQKAQTTFCLVHDDLHRRRHKTTHTQGVVAWVEFIPTEDTPYTGMFGEGNDTIVMRLSETQNLHEGSKGLQPSLALKFLMDGEQSVNIVAMESFLPSESFDFFNAALSNRVEQFDTTNQVEYIMDETLRKKMTEGSIRPFATGLSEVARKKCDGSVLANDDVVSPFQIFFKSPLKGLMEGNDIEWYSQVVDLADEGDVVYEVFAQPDPYDKAQKKIGDLVLRSPMTTSHWADKNLFFRHVRAGKDRKFWPKNWRGFDRKFERTNPANDFMNNFDGEFPSWPEDRELAREAYIEQTEEWGCPFEWLMPKNWLQ